MFKFNSLLLGSWKFHFTCNFLMIAGSEQIKIRVHSVFSSLISSSFMIVASDDELPFSFRVEVPELLFHVPLLLLRDHLLGAFLLLRSRRRQLLIAYDNVDEVGARPTSVLGLLEHEPEPASESDPAGIVTRAPATP